IGAAVIGGCAAPAMIAAPPSSAEPPADTHIAAPQPADNSPQSQLRYHILAGEIAAGRQLPGEAAKEFLQALEIQPDAKLAARTTALALSAEDNAIALQAAHKWLEADPSSLDAREVITRVAVRQGHADEAYEQCVA